MRLRLSALSVAIALTGCAHNEPKERVVTVTVKVKEPCIEKAPEKPVYRFGKGPRPASDAEKAKILADDFERSERYGDDWAAAAAGCFVVPPQGSSAGESP